MESVITMAYGSGGKKTSELIEGILLPAFSNDELDRLSDGAYLNFNGRVVFSTDSFVVKPIFFPGGDIGKLSVCGTVNDISVCGGEPKALSLSFIIEEGFAVSDLKKIVESIKLTAEISRVKIVTGDTKVVEKGNGDGIYINTSGIGVVDDTLEYGIHRIEAGDKVVVSGTLGDHGLAVLAARENLFLSSSLKSDCAPLNGLIKSVNKYKDSIKIMRDPTRGGIATTLKEFVEGNAFSIKIYDELIPIKDEVRGVCEMLGIDPLYSANEGKVVFIVKSSDAEDLVKALKENPLGRDAAVIGEVIFNMPGRLFLDTGFGSTRVLDKLAGDQLPRIC